MKFIVAWHLLYPQEQTHELRRFLRLLLLNINYLRYQFLSKPWMKILWILNTQPNG